MRLFIHLLNGEEASLDSSAEELVWQLLAKSRQALQQPEIRWLVTAAGARLLASDTLTEAGLADGERLTAVIGPRPEPVLLGASSEICDAEVVRKAVAQTGSVVVLPSLFWHDETYPPENWAWAELAHAEGLEVRCCLGPDAFPAVAEGLAQIPRLRRLELSVEAPEAEQCVKKLLSALPRNLEVLVLRGNQVLSNAHGFIACLQQWQRLRVLGIYDESCASWPETSWQQLFKSLPVCLEEFVLSPPDTKLAEALPKLPSLRKFNLNGWHNCPISDALEVVLAALPATLEELHLRGATFVVVDPAWWLQQLQRFPEIRKVSLPRSQGSPARLQAILTALPANLDEICVEVPDTWPLVESMKNALLRWRSLRRLCFYRGTSSVEPKVWDTLLGAAPHSLEQLDLAYCGLSQEAACAAANHFQRLVRLKWVDLSLNPKGLLPLLGGLPDCLESVCISLDDLTEEQRMDLRSRLSAAQLAHLKGKVRLSVGSHIEMHRDSEEKLRVLLA